MPFNLRGPEILILILIILLLFGAKRLPDVARGLGRSLRILKSETKDLHADSGDETSPDTPAVDAPPRSASLPAAETTSASAPKPQPERTES